MPRLGVAIIGFNGAVSTTIMAGVKLMLEGKAPRHGMLTERVPERSPTERNLTDLLPFTPLEDVVFGGWDIHDRDLYTSSLEHGVFRAEQLEPVKAWLKDQRPWPAVFSSAYATNISGEHTVSVNGHREQVAQIQADLENFKQQNDLDEVVVVNLASTEKWLERTPAHQTLSAFEQALDANDPAISPTMRYVYACNAAGCPHANFTPSLANVPALEEQAIQNGVPYCGMDGKTGQTLVKTTLGAMFRARRLWIDGWYSVNFLGNNDGLVLNDPESNKTKIASKASVLDSVAGHTVPNHQIHIHYYKPRGDNKEAWDNIDILGFGGIPMQVKVNFLCQDSVLAAPLVVDMVRILEVAHRKGDKGIQRQCSIFFKSPYHREGEAPIHDVFEQERMLFAWAEEAATKDDVAVDAAAQVQ